MNSNGYISRQISVYKTNKKLVEFIDKLRTAPISTFAHIHANADKDDKGNNMYSLIGITVQDYSKGTGDKTVRASANLSPDDIHYIFNELTKGVDKFEYAKEKIFGTPDAAGKSTVTKVRIARASIGGDGKPRNYPWFIEVDNGTGIAAKSSTGGTYIQKNSFVSTSKAFANINDEDFFKLLKRVDSYITAWEMAFGINLIRSGVKAIADSIEQNTNN